ncbi:hypothetical protein PPTG_20785 [Phytophthora nicotianae INRA-310]|uniref:Uncharacterized protein n=1 Tax=Phytophthora nicotianae (strain INRA-310) TaxID=761204 RepID=W2RGM1_PHYN3|nr:hypothetical protein PPTG_20785 [Phytophthora nicotianae INRA-310]ETN24361.1 hypothetical protein PPTG_20785 [Phytophthora nicotianae INRA-310]
MFIRGYGWNQTVSDPSETSDVELNRGDMVLRSGTPEISALAKHDYACCDAEPRGMAQQ